MPEYECDKCGACCQGYLIVEADELDVLREPRLIDADPKRSGQSYDQVLADLAEPGRCLLIAVNRPCTLLDAENRCSIHPTRPNACVAMQAGDEQCRMARQSAGLPSLEPTSSGQT